MSNLEQALANAEQRILANDYYCKQCKYGTLIMSRQDKTYEKNNEIQFAYTAELTIVCEIQAKKLFLFQEVFNDEGKPDWIKQDDLTTVRFCEARKKKDPETQTEEENA